MVFGSYHGKIMNIAMGLKRKDFSRSYESKVSMFLERNSHHVLMSYQKYNLDTDESFFVFVIPQNYRIWKF